MKHRFLAHRHDSLFRPYCYRERRLWSHFKSPFGSILGGVTGATLGAFWGVWRGPPIRLLHVFYRVFRSKSWLLGGCDLNSPGEGFGDRFGVDCGGHFSDNFSTPWGVPAELPSNVESSKKLVFLIHSSDLSLRKPKSSCF